MTTKTDIGFALKSMVFSNNGHIPSRYTCEGENINPPLEFSGVPDGTKSIALIMEDPDAPQGAFTHWLLWNISPNISISEKSNPGISGRNSFGKTGYGGPCPPSGVHRYFFRAYALDTQLELLGGAGKQDLLDSIKGHVIGTAELMGQYSKKNRE